MRSKIGGIHLNITELTEDDEALIKRVEKAADHIEALGISGGADQLRGLAVAATLNADLRDAIRIIAGQEV